MTVMYSDIPPQTLFLEDVNYVVGGLSATSKLPLRQTARPKMDANMMSILC